MKQVWQTGDGGLFESREEAEQWDIDREVIKSFTDFLKGQEFVYREYEARQLAVAILANYIVTPK